MISIVLASAGAGIGLGVWLIILGSTPHPQSTVDTVVGVPSAPGVHRATVTERLRATVGTRRGLARCAVTVVSAGAVWTVTGWPVAAILAGAAIWVLPPILGPDRAHAMDTARIEAIATWTESLRDTLSAAAGIEQAIRATAPTAPAPIREPVQALAALLAGGAPLTGALHRFADEVADPTADLVVAALILAGQRQSGNLTDLLATLAATAREQAVMRLRVATSRARTRTSIRMIVIVTVVMAVSIVVLNRSYLDPYNTVLGQAVLAAVGVIFTGAFAWLVHIGRGGPAPRLFAGPSAVSHAGGWSR